MAQRTTKILRDSGRIRRARRAFRRWWIFALALAAAAVWLFTRDIRWQARNDEARTRGRAAELAGQMGNARAHYREALKNNPYDWQAHLFLARILQHWQNDRDDALRHYLYAMAYCPDNAAVEEMSRAVAILSMVRDGSLENPVDAVEDMFRAVESGSMQLFRQRLHASLAASDFDLFWKAWNERGRGTPFYSSIAQEADGEYEAGVEVSYPDGVGMFMRFTCRRHDIWRLSLSFP